MIETYKQIHFGKVKIFERIEQSIEPFQKFIRHRNKVHKEINSSAGITYSTMRYINRCEVEWTEYFKRSGAIVESITKVREIRKFK